MPLAAASLMTCLAWSSRRLSRKLQQGGHKGVMWVREYARSTHPTEEVASVHTAHDGGQHIIA